MVILGVMGGAPERDLQQQLDEVRARLAAVEACLGALQEDVRRAGRRADASEALAAEESERIGALETRGEVDREMIRELQAEGLISREHASHLEAALQTSRMIGAAVGIIMAFYGVTESGAFELLRRASADGNRKLRAVAEEVVLTGRTAGLPPR